jgi:hypothetical protein
LSAVLSLIAALPALGRTTAAEKVGIHPLRDIVSFEKNTGQAPASILFAMRLGAINAAIERDGGLRIAPVGSSAPFRVVPLGASDHPHIEGSEPVDFRTNYILGQDPAGYVLDVPHYREVALRNIRPGVDLVYHATGRTLEFDYVVSPGADARAIALRIEGASSVSIEEGGDLRIADGETVLRQKRPVAYQDIGGARVGIKCDYRLAAENVVEIALGDYDASRELIIDPVVDYSSYMGGASDDFAAGIRIGPDGFIYVTGTTSSSNFPTRGALDSTLGGSTDIFIAKINPATGKAVYATYLGGGNADSASAIAVDASGNVYVTGIPGSRFPTTSGAYQTSASGTYGFVSKLSAAGNTLLYSTLVAGTRPMAIEVDSQGRAVLTGSAGTSFTTTAGSYQAAYGGSSGSVDATSQGDAFALMLNTGGTGAVFATFFGGSGTDEAHGIAIDGSGRIVLGGSTTSANLPMSAPYQPTLAGGTDAFIAMLSAAGSALVSSTYYGGTGTDQITGLSLDPYGNVVVGGNTTSADLPTPNAILPVGSLSKNYVNIFTQQPAYQKGFVAKFSQAPYGLAFATYVAAHVDCCDSVDSVAVDAAGDVFVSGSSKVDSVNGFVQVNPFLSNFTVRRLYAQADQDAIYAASYSRDGQELRFQSYMAPCFVGLACGKTAMAARTTGQAVIAGATASNSFPITAANGQAVNTSTNGVNDAFVMTVAVEKPALTLTSSVPAPLAAAAVTLRATAYTGAATGTITFFDGSTALGSAPLVEGIAKMDVSFPAGVRRLSASFGASTAPTVLLPVSVTSGSCP